MTTLTELLKAQVGINFYEAPEDEKKFIIGTAKAVNRAWLEEKLQKYKSKLYPYHMIDVETLFSELLSECSVQRDEQK